MLPVSLSNPFCLSDCRTLDAMLAVPAMPPIEKDQVRLCRTICRLVDAEEPFD
jgi:hypothetical protein